MTSHTITGNTLTSGYTAALGGAFTLFVEGIVGGNGAAYGVLDTLSSATLSFNSDGQILSSKATGVGVRLTQGGRVLPSSGLNSIAGAAGIIISGGLGTVVNSGKVTAFASAAGTFGVALIGGGVVTNRSGGTINGAYGGVAIQTTTATVINQGSIHGGTWGVSLSAGGYVSNSSGGTISGGKGVTVSGGAGTIVTGGLISAAGAAVLLTAGYTNLLQLNPGASFFGKVDGGNSIGSAGTSISTLELASAASAGTLTGFGSQFVNFGSVYVAQGATWTLAEGTTAGIGTVASGVTLYDNGTLTNAGLIDTPVTLGPGAVLSNAASGSITLSGLAPAVSGTTGETGTVFNAGDIHASGFFGVYLPDGGSVTNTGTGAIGAALIGVRVKGGAGTVSNAATISGGTNDAVLFAAGYSNRLIVGPGAVFTGTVDGGNTIGSTGTSISTLELASGASSGTLSGFGTHFVDFGVVTVDANASWTMPKGTTAGGGTIEAGVTLIDNGSLSNAGAIDAPVTLGLGGYLYNDAGASIGSGTKQAVFGQAGLSATVVNGGGITGTGAYGVYLDGGGNVSNNGTGAISGGTDGIEIKGAAAYITNQVRGTITGTIGSAIRDDASVAATVVNYGVLSGEGDDGITFLGGGTATNGTTGLITALTNGIFINGGSGSVTNQSGGTITAGTGVYLFQGGSVTNSGLIKGTAQYGVEALQSAIVTNNVSGVVTGAVSGIVLISGGSVTNYGLIAATSNFGIDIQTDGGSVTNNSSAAVKAGLVAVIAFKGGANVTNLSGGTLSGTMHEAVYLKGALSSVTNAGLIESAQGIGVDLLSGGVVLNRAGGMISAGGNGIVVVGGAAFVSNAATIVGHADAVSLAAGYLNRVIAYPGAVFTGIVDGGNTIGATSVSSTLELASGASAGVLSALGSNYIDFAQVSVDAGAVWTLSGGGSVAFGVTVTNSGTLTGIGTLTNAGLVNGSVSLAAGAVLSNVTSASITSGLAAAVYGTAGGPATVVNAGSITERVGYGVSLLDGGAVSNLSNGVISSKFNDAISSNAAAAVTNQKDGTITGGIQLLAGGTIDNTGLIDSVTFAIVGSGHISVTNNGSGVITGLDKAILVTGGGADITNQSGGTISHTVGSAVGFIGVDVESGVGGVTNAGVILAGQYLGIELGNGGTVTNQAGGTISAAQGVIMSGGAGTVGNAGKINGGTLAVQLAAGFANRLIADPGAVFTGIVDGGNTIGSTGTSISTLELASATSSGTLTGLGSNYINFARVSVDSGAAWTLGGGGSIAAGVTVTNSGTLTGAGTLTNAGLIYGPLSLAAGAVLSNVTNASVKNGLTAAVYGATGGTGTVVNAGAINGIGAYGVYLRDGGSVSNSGPGAIQGGIDGVEVRGAAASITNQPGGTISGIAASGIEVVLGVTGTVNNYGVLSGTFGDGISLRGGGTATNQTNGTITGAHSGIFVAGGSGTVTNQSGGTIAGGRVGVYLNAGGSLSNAGRITGTVAIGAEALGGRGSFTNNGSGVIMGGNAGIFAYTGGDVTNFSGGTISGTTFNSVYIDGGSGTVANAGVIQSAKGKGVQLGKGGTVVNQAGGTISAAGFGVLVAGGAGTVTNAGTISGYGGTGDAVSLASGFANRLILNPGAAFIGLVDGGNPRGSGTASTLELAPALVEGSLADFGTEFIDFTQVTVDQGGTWAFASDTLPSLTTITDLGVLLVNGSSVAGGGSVTVDNAGGVAASMAVSGAGVWSGGSNFVIGGTAAGALLVAGAGSIGATGIDVARSAGSSGTITVTDAKSSLSDTGSFVIGDAGGGNLAIGGGGGVSAGAGLTIANTVSASGSSINVSGAGSNLQVTGALVVGASGFGSLSLSQGASGTASSLDLAASATGDGAISIAGIGTTLDIAGSLILGDQAAGELSILGGAQMTIAGGVIGGSGINGTGNLDIEDNGSQLTINAGTLVVGANGPAEFTLGIGATLDGEVATDPNGVTNEYGNVDPPTLLNDGAVNAGNNQSGSSQTDDFYIANSGTITTKGTATFYAPLATFETAAQDSSTSGLWVIGAHDTLVMNTTSVDNSQTFQFNGTAAAELVIGQVPSGNINNLDTLNGQTTPVLTASIAPGSPSVLPGWEAPIENYASGDVIALRGLTYGSATASGDVVTVWSGAAGQGTALGSLVFLDKGNPSTGDAAAAAMQINALECFAAGTRIETVDGLVAVERLLVGDKVVTADGRCEPVVWVGCRRVVCARYPKPETVWPMRVSAGAFGENVPVRELYLSPDHAVFVNGVLVPVKLLENGTSITQVKRTAVTYYHVELPEHAVILAEGLPVESYLDTGDRENFDDNGTIGLFPDYAAHLKPDAARHWETRGAAPLVVAGAKLTAARRVVTTNGW